MTILYWFESIRNPILDGFMYLVTNLGGETFFLVLTILIFWCVSKMEGYYMLTVGFFGTIMNQFLKLWFRVPRPWVKDPKFSIVETARASATGYSFPSGHTQNVWASLGAPARMEKRKWVRVIASIFLILTAISRMYLGVHTPMDVGVSFVIGGILVFALYPVFSKANEKPNRVSVLFGIMLLFSICYLIFVEVYSFPKDIDAANLEEGVKNAYTLFGSVVAVFIGFHIEKKFIRFETKATLWAQIVKVCIGLAGTLLIRIVLKTPLDLLFQGNNISNAIRYFLMVIFAICIWPLTFKWFAKRKPIRKKI